MSRRPCTERCKWCSRINTDRPQSTCDVSTQTSRDVPDHDDRIEDGSGGNNAKDNPEAPVLRCSAVKFEHDWTTEYLRQCQYDEPDIKSFIQLMETSENKPEWSTISDRSTAFKTLWSQWNQLSLTGGLLRRRWESDDGKRVRDQIVLPQQLRRNRYQCTPRQYYGRP